jgi:glutamine amidotransferase
MGKEAKKNMESLLASCEGSPLIGALCGHIFERYTIELLEKGGTFTCRSLGHGKKRKKSNVTSILQIQKSTKKVADKVLLGQTYNQLYVPKTSNYVAIDAWIPGVGAFQASMKKILNSLPMELIEVEVLHKNKPFLGICVGMQMLANGSHENGWHTGLGWINGEVKKLELPKPYSIPHVGWNDIVVKKHSELFSRSGDGTNFYFDHSYHFECEEQYLAATCDYGITVTAAVQNENIFGVQFHPEKSQNSGLKLFRGFLNSI